MRLPTKPSHTPACTPTLPIFLAIAMDVAITSLAVFSRAHDLQQAHDVGGREEVQADHVLRPLGDGCDLVHVERRGVGGDDGAGLGDLVELGEDLLLQRHVLEHGLDDEIGRAEVLQFQRRRQPGHALLGLRFRGAAALDVGLQRVLDARDALVERLLRGLDDGQRKAGVEEREPDARSHGAGAEDADRLDVAQLARRGRCRAGSPPAARRRTRTAARGHRGWRPPRGTARARARLPSASGIVAAASTASMAAFGAIGPLGWRASEPRAFSNRPAGTLSIFCLADAARRLAHLLLGEGDGRRDHVTVGQLVDQAGGGALGRVDEGARGDELQGLLHADRARQALRAAGARNDAELDLGQPELAHVLGRDAIVAAQRQLQAAAERRAVHRGHHRLGRLSRSCR